MGYHRILDCNTGCCDTPETLASVTRTGAVLTFADTKGKQTTIDLTELLPDVKALVSAERSGTKLNFTDNKGGVTTLDLADLIPAFNGVTDMAVTTAGIRITMSDGQTKDLDLTSLIPDLTALASVTRTGAVLTFADTKGKQTTIDLTDMIPDLTALVSVARDGSKLNFADNKGNTTTINLADIIPAFDGVSDIAGTATGIRVTLGNGQSKTIDLSKLYTAPVALKSVARNGTTLTFTDTAGNAHTVELDAMPEVPVTYKDAKLNGATLRFTDTAGNTHDVSLASLIPASKADRFLSKVRYDNVNKTLAFTTSATGEADTTFDVSVADLLPVVAGTGLQGDGTEANPLSIKLATDSGLVQDNAGLRLENPKPGVQRGTIEGKNLLLKDGNNQTVSTISLAELIPDGASQGETGDSKGSGYQKFASGIIFQWGRVTEYGDQYKRVEFPIPFPNACVSVHATPIVNNGITGNLVVSAHVGGIDNTGCSIGTTENGVVMGETSWLAIGY